QQVALNENINIDLFNYSYNKGWMCVQVFFVRQGKLLERDVSIFPFYNEADEAFISFIGQFYWHKRNLLSIHTLLPIGTDAEMMKQLLKVEKYTPFRWKKKDLVELAGKYVKIALDEPFSLIQLDEDRTIKSVERLGDL